MNGDIATGPYFGHGIMLDKSSCLETLDIKDQNESCVRVLSLISSCNTLSLCAQIYRFMHHHPQQTSLLFVYHSDPTPTIHIYK